MYKLHAQNKLKEFIVCKSVLHSAMWNRRQELQISWIPHSAWSKMHGFTVLDKTHYGLLLCLKNFVHGTMQWGLYRAVKVIHYITELSVGMTTEGIDVRSVGNTLTLHETALVEAFNLKAAIEYQLKNCKYIITE